MKLFVSSSQGRDTNNCLSPETACQTISRGYSLLRDRSPDWLLLRRGDTWNESLSLDRTNWTKSGLSETEMMVVASYGDSRDRPRLETGRERCLHVDWDPVHNGGLAPQSHLAFVGIHCISQGNDHVGQEPNGGWFRGAFADILIEDVVFENYSDIGLVMQRAAGGDAPQNVKIRRSIVVDSYAKGVDENSSGFYLAGIHQLLLDENIVDYNGWHEGEKAWNVFAKNYYTGYGVEGMVLRGNILSRADGVDCRSGCLAEENLFIRSSIGLTVGVSHPGSAEENVGGRVVRNVFLEGMSLDPSQPRGHGIDINNISANPGLEIAQNIFANGMVIRGTGQPAFQLGPYNDPGVGIHNVRFHDNIIYRWGGGIDLWEEPEVSRFPRRNIVIENNVVIGGPREGYQGIMSLQNIDLQRGPVDTSNYTIRNNSYLSEDSTDGLFDLDGRKITSLAEWQRLMGEEGSTVGTMPGFVDPGRTTATYHATLGREASFDAFIAQVRLQTKGTGFGPGDDGRWGTLPGRSDGWRDEYTARAVNTYIRAGFELR